MMTSAKVILDSVSPTGVRLTTMEATFHRFVLAEFNTHRVFSRNSASSRAIPVEKQLERFSMNPAIPLSLPAEQAGMQGGSELEGQDRADAQTLIQEIHSSLEILVENYLGDHPEKSSRLHKSVLNRYLEPFMWHTVIVSSTMWDNFFAQRCSPLAQPEIKAVAELMRDEYNNSTPVQLNRNQYHTPYIQADEKLDLETAKAVSAARCARVSYLTHDGIRSIDEDLKLYERLISADPGHWSPLEHIARPALSGRSDTRGNYRGWAQLRHEIETP